MSGHKSLIMQPLGEMKWTLGTAILPWFEATILQTRHVVLANLRSEKCELFFWILISVAFDVLVATMAIGKLVSSLGSSIECPNARWLDTCSICLMIAFMLSNSPSLSVKQEAGISIIASLGSTDIKVLR